MKFLSNGRPHWWARFFCRELAWDCWTKSTSLSPTKSLLGSPESVAIDASKSNRPTWSSPSTSKRPQQRMERQWIQWASCCLQYSACATESQKTSSKNSSAPRPIASFHNFNVKSITAYQSSQNIPAIFQHKG